MPSQYRNRPSGVGYHPAGAFISAQPHRVSSWCRSVAADRSQGLQHSLRLRRRHGRPDKFTVISIVRRERAIWEPFAACFRLRLSKAHSLPGLELLPLVIRISTPPPVPSCAKLAVVVEVECRMCKRDVGFVVPMPRLPLTVELPCAWRAFEPWKYPAYPLPVVSARTQSEALFAFSLRKIGRAHVLNSSHRQ